MKRGVDGVRDGGQAARRGLSKIAERLRKLSGRGEDELRVFVSYRREAGPGQAHHLATDLERHLGSGHVFLDERAIGAGDDFDRVIRERVSGADVLLAVIGPGWVGSERRLHQPGDYVRREIEAALHQRVPVIAVATPGATMPEPSDLPAELQPLIERPELAIDIPSDSLWEVAVDSLVQWLLAIAKEKHRRDAQLSRARAQHSECERDLERARRRRQTAQAALAAASERLTQLDAQRPEAEHMLAERRQAAEPRRAGGGIRVLVNSRQESAHEARRLTDALAAQIGSEGVLEAGKGAVASADVLIVLIGPRWRADSDEVAAEIEAAIGRGIVIMPLLTGRAQLPELETLPAALRPFLAHQALMLPEQFFEEAVQRVGERLKAIESAIAQRERALATAEERCRTLERDTARIRQELARVQADAEASTDRVTAAEVALAAAAAREAELAAEPGNTNAAFLAGPPVPRALTTR